jgi:hypothetical protein
MPGPRTEASRDGHPLDSKTAAKLQSAKIHPMISKASRSFFNILLKAPPNIHRTIA